jgi:hypothetical protein
VTRPQTEPGDTGPAAVRRHSGLFVGAAAATLGLAGLAAGLFGGDEEQDGDGGPAAPLAAPPPRPVPRGVAEVRGSVRDDAGAPLPGALIRDKTSGRSVRADRRGAFVLRVRLTGRGHDIVATRPGLVPHSQRLDATGRRPMSFSLWRTAPATAGVVNSAHRVTFWLNCDYVASLSDGDLRRWSERGVGGFACMTGLLHGLGGKHRFTPRRTAAPRGHEYALQRRLASSDFARRARRHGIKTYLGFYTEDYNHRSTPFADWFDDRGWSRRVLPRVRELTATARKLGFAGVALDQEPYQSDPNSWRWDYPGSERPEAEVRAAVRRRGGQLMRTMSAAFPNLEVVAYLTELPEGWNAKVREAVNANRDAYRDHVHLDLWDGITSVRRYRAIRLYESILYKTPHIAGATWDDSLRENARAIYSLLSREFSAWDYAEPRVQMTPFAWIDDGPSHEFERARPPQYVAEQLAAFRRWGTGGEFANFAFADPAKFDYRPYEPGLRAAAKPGQVDAEAPRVELTPPAGRIAVRGDRVELTGTAADNFAVRSVRWRDDRGNGGIARMTVDPSTGDRVTWRISAARVDRRATALWLRVEDIKRLASIRRFELQRAGS